MHIVMALTNNKFYLWFVKGYIAHEKGIKINWAKITTSIIKEKVQKKVTKWKHVHCVIVSES